MVAWLKSYLVGRSYRVRVLNCLSNRFVGLSGVPQGSVLSPLLFVLFVNDCLNVLPPDGLLMYADDLKIFFPVSSSEDCCELQNVLSSFSVWCEHNGLRLCPLKCNTITFGRSTRKVLWNYTLRDIPINRVNSVKDLGVWLDEKLTFKDHIDFVTSKAYRTLGLITRLSHFIRDPLCLKSLYCCPIFDYACVVWSPNNVQDIARLEGVQRKFTRLATRRFLSGHDNAVIPSYPHRCRLLGLDLIKTRHSHLQACFIASVILNELDVPYLLSAISFYAPSRHLRNRPPLYIPTRLTRYGQNDPFLKAQIAFNSYYHLFDFNTPLSLFRSRLHSSSSLSFP